ncbi:MAG: malate synthase A [Trueperaceae bacterium]
MPTNSTSNGHIAVPTGDHAGILSEPALRFVAALHEEFEPRRRELLAARNDRQAAFDRGELPSYPDETENIRNAAWSVAATPGDLQDRRVEITGPVDRKMVINALNSGASVFMADFEDSLAPTWQNILQGQINLRDAVRRTISLDDASRGKRYTLNDRIATLVVRPRGWHLTERHLTVDGEPVSASIFDFALYLFHNAEVLTRRGSGPYYYLPKLENRLEARLWNDVFVKAQEYLGIPQGTVRATVLIETILAAFEMEEILYEIRDHAAGLNAGRWDYIFSIIKKFRNREDLVLPDRAQVTMSIPFMSSYTDALVRACHKRGAHAIGGMAAFIPSRSDQDVNAMAFEKVHEDKQLEADKGFDGTWVAHPGLVAVAREVFDQTLGDRQNQKHELREQVTVAGERLVDFEVADGAVTATGVRNNVSVALQYINSWLNGNGAAAINNLMEDAATAEISRAQLWQWIRNATRLDDGRTMTAEFYWDVRAEELQSLGGEENSRYREAAAILDKLVLEPEFIDFLTLPAYEYLD